MTTVPAFKRFTSFEFAVGIGALPVYVNPLHVAYCQARRRYDPNTNHDVLDGTVLYFQQEAGVLAVKEDLGYVVAALQSGKGGVCRECNQVLEESWATLCTDCNRQKAAV